MITTVYVATFVGLVALIAGGSMLFWRWWILSKPAPPHWQDAFRCIWCDVYGLAWDARPRVIWVSGPFVSGGRTVYGIHDDGAVTVAIADRVSNTAFAHELRHAARVVLGLGADGEHLSDNWSPDGVVARANAALRERGW